MKLKLKVQIIVLALIIMSVLVAHATAQTITPPVQWSDNGHWYQFVSPFSGWLGARQWAENHGGYLATIASAEENAFLVAILDQVHSSANLGGYEPNNDGNWVWITGEPWSYTNWIPGQPSNTGGNENYLGLTESAGWGWGGWNDGDSLNINALIEYNLPLGFIYVFFQD